jgi:hypothetical protein
LNLITEVAALSTEDGSMLWSVQASEGSLPIFGVQTILAIDQDGDSLTESVLICDSNRTLWLLDAHNGDTLWHSEVPDGGHCVATLQLTTAGRPQFVALMSSGHITAFDAETHEQSWVLTSGDGAWPAVNGMAYLPHGAEGPELAVYDSHGIQFFDLETRTPLRLIQNEFLYEMQGLAQPSEGSIYDLIVPVDGTIAIVDGITGAVRARSTEYGYQASSRNHLKLFKNPDGSTLIGTGTHVATFTHRLEGIGDSIFFNDFDLPNH